MRTTAKQRRDAEICAHGMKLIRTFEVEDILPVTLYKKLHRIQARVQTRNERRCGDGRTFHETDQDHAAFERRTLDSINRLIDFRGAGVPVILNTDPRGYALKVRESYMRDHPECSLPKDWGGYGLLVPDF